MTLEEIENCILAFEQGKDLLVPPEPSGSGLLSSISRRLVFKEGQYYWAQRTLDLRDKIYFDNFYLIGDREQLIADLRSYQVKQIRLQDPEASKI
jgi:hypothetical protein